MECAIEGALETGGWEGGWTGEGRRGAGVGWKGKGGVRLVPEKAWAGAWGLGQRLESKEY